MTELCHRLDFARQGLPKGLQQMNCLMVLPLPQVPEAIQGDEAQGTEELVPADPEGPAVPAYKDTPHHPPRPQV